MRNPGVVPGGGVDYARLVSVFGTDSEGQRHLDVIRSKLTDDEFRGYLLGSVIKFTLVLKVDDE